MRFTSAGIMQLRVEQNFSQLLLLKGFLEKYHSGFSLFLQHFCHKLLPISEKLSNVKLQIPSQRKIVTCEHTETENFLTTESLLRNSVQLHVDNLSE